jgi:hypothetical protein
MDHRIRRLITLVVLTLCTAVLLPDNTAVLHAEQPAAVIPVPESFFGFADGERHVRHDQLLAYLGRLADISDRITFEQYGMTYEQRPLALLVITHPENHARLEALRTRHALLADPERSAAVALEDLPAVLWLGFTVHGNEASGANAVPRIVYDLATARGTGIEEQLRHVIIIIDPCVNPDGYGRFSGWVNGNRGMRPVADAATREHNEMWPGGRGNHYWFDLNRDYMPLVHTESRARMEQYYRWLPDLVLDFHEMSTASTYFFQPGRPSAIHPLIPQGNRTLTHSLAGRLARSLDAIGSLYFTEEIFDDLFVGKGSTYTDLTGSVGILLEQASVRGHRQEHPQGTITFPFAIRNQLTTAQTAIEASAALRLELLEYKRTFFRSAGTEARRSPVRAYVTGTDADPYRVALLAGLLQRHRIVVRELAAPLTVNGQTYAPGSSILVETDQPQYRLVRSLFETRTVFEDSIFYDISSWTLPYAYGLRSTEVRTVPERIRGPVRTNEMFPKGPDIVAEGMTLAYVFDWGQHRAPAVTARLLAAGAFVRVAMVPFRSAGADHGAAHGASPAGTIMVPLGPQPQKSDTIAAILRAAARHDGLTVRAVATGLTPEGIDLGSDRMRPLAPPKVLIAAGSGVSSVDAGEVWHLLDRSLEMDVTLADPAQFGRISLGRYSVVIMPAGTYATIDSAGTAAMRSWVENGGTLIAMESAIRWVTLSKLSPVAIMEKPQEPGADSLVLRRPYADMGAAEGARSVSGAIVAAEIDRTHPLGFGVDSSMLPLCRTSTLLMRAPRDPYATPLSYASRPLLSGYLPRGFEAHLRNTPAVIVSMLKNGRIIQIADDPVFRGFWHGSERILINAVFFGPLLRSTSFTGERD